jgi:hypothetical protein
MKMKSALLASFVLGASTAAAVAQANTITPVDPAPFRKLSCDEIASRIRALNGPIGDDGSTIAGFKRAENPVLFFLFGTTSRSAEYERNIALQRGERNALIHVAVEKNCAAGRLVPFR